MGMVQYQDPIRPIGGQLLHRPFLGGAEQHCRHLAPGRGGQRPGFAEHLQRDASEAPARHLGYDPDALPTLGRIPPAPHLDTGTGGRSGQECQALPHQRRHLLGCGGGVRLGDDHAQTVGRHKTDIGHPGR
jgi:hypothetical protein